MLQVKHTRSTGPQRAFWECESRIKLLCGGVGSGKSRGGAVEVLRQPAGTTGVILAPTYPMLRDATLRTLLDLVEGTPLLVDFNRSEMKLTLLGNRTVLLRSADRPDRLRGPNLSWAFLDEAALMSRAVFLVVLGRLRVAPGKLWITTTPRGKNWLYDEFCTGKPGRTLIRASTRTNPFLPSDFVGTLEAAYDPGFLAQEVDGDFLDDTTLPLIPPAWIDACADPSRTGRPNRGTPRWMGVDPAGGSGKGDTSAVVVRDDQGILELWSSNAHGVLPQALHRLEPEVVRLARKWDVPGPRVIFDRGGLGETFDQYLAQHGLPGARGYRGGGVGGAHFGDLRTAVAHKLRRRLDPTILDQVPFAIPPGDHWIRLREELVNLRSRVESSSMEGPRQRLERKAEMAARLGRSPDFLDALMMSFAFHQS